MSIPAPYKALLEAIQFEVGVAFDHNNANLDALAEAMDWKPRQVYAALSVMERQGLVAALRSDPRDQRPSRWFVTPEGREAA